jgi:hypothetical protein
VSAPTLLEAASAATTDGLLGLPVDPDEGFPQSFLLALAGATYRFDLYVDVPEHELPEHPDPRDPLDLVGAADSPAQGILVGAVVRQNTDGTSTTLIRRRLLPGLLYRAQELLVAVDEVRIARGNLNGAGTWGSVLTARVGLR